VRRATFDPVSFVRNLYIRVLLRQPDNEGLAFHVARLDGGMDPAKLAGEFIESPEATALRQQSTTAVAPPLGNPADAKALEVGRNAISLLGWRRRLARLIGLSLPKSFP